MVKELDVVNILTEIINLWRLDTSDVNIAGINEVMIN